MDRIRKEHPDWVEEDVKTRYEDAEVLRPGQDFERPTEWPKLTKEDLEWDTEEDVARIAPRWGANAEVADNE